MISAQQSIPLHSPVAFIRLAILSYKFSTRVLPHYPGFSSRFSRLLSSPCPASLTLSKGQRGPLSSHFEFPVNPPCQIARSDRSNTPAHILYPSRPARPVSLSSHTCFPFCIYTRAIPGTRISQEGGIRFLVASPSCSMSSHRDECSQDRRLSINCISS